MSSGSGVRRGARYVAPQNRLNWEILSLRRRRPGVCQLRDDYGFAPDIPGSATTGFAERHTLLRNRRSQVRLRTLRASRGEVRSHALKTATTDFPAQLRCLGCSIRPTLGVRRGNPRLGRGWRVVVMDRCLRNFSGVALSLLLTSSVAWAQATAGLAGRA